MMVALPGFLAGCLHVVSGPDHLAAVAPLTVRQPHRAWLVGVRWGVGHAGGVALVGVLLLWLRQALPLEALSAWSERLVGVVLIGIGLWGLRVAWRHRLHVHEHVHRGRVHTHLHAHAAASAHDRARAGSHAHSHAAFAVGTLHGLAGSSHFLGVLPALAFPTTIQTITYLGAYGLGTVTAMAAFSSLVGLTAGGLARRGLGASKVLLLGCSAAAVGVGGWWLVA